MARLEEIEVSLTAIAMRIGNPLFIPDAGESGYLAWRDYERSKYAQMPYPGTRLAQPDWFENDVAGFNDMEHWCYLKHEEVALMKAINKRIPEQDRAWAK